MNHRVPDPAGVVGAAAVAAEDWERAHEVARMPLPATWPEDVRRAWGRRRLARATAGKDNENQSIIRSYL